MAILEAMAAECPVVATDVGGVHTVIENEVNGLLVPPRDPDARRHESGVASRVHP